MEKNILSQNNLIATEIKEKNDVDVEVLKDQFLSLNAYSNDLVDSLKYAEIIQKGVLPKDRHFKLHFKEYLLLYLPHSIVSGDFYWVGEVGGKVIFAVGDCTGHGVPGAMLTMLAQSFLNHIVLGKGLTDTAEILVEFDKKFIETFQDEKEDSYSNDWIDMALCCYDKKQMTLSFSGAKRKALHMSEGVQNIYKGSNYPIGGWQIERNRTFDSETIALKEGDMLYLGSDGFQDQIGGERSKKFGSKKLHILLGEIAEDSCKEQKAFLLEKISGWKKNQEQMDDICLLGIRF
jgi:serine phosphatase RsbU (regulator of sigma subunit)